ncbi:MAG: ribosome biogenesis GTP-binding protein YihA/YsxC [Opitutaceae bacterium]|nr:ribosome biogenesis GTP-binding protein YihA/YsxC [Opitutaceae bacterium]
MKITQAEFETSSPDLDHCPRLAMPEFACIGRSNVGKSSLINSLVGRKSLARVSDLPGKTRTMNFYRINGNWRLVDLPGYGYAKIGKQQRADFNEAAAAYLESRPTLLRILVLIDVRLPAQEIDLAFLEWAQERRLPLALIFTKADKLAKSVASAAMRQYRDSALGDWPDVPPMILTSSKDGLGRAEVLKLISEGIAKRRS